MLALVFLVGARGVLAGGYFWWRSFQRSPAYSLALIADAARRGDDATFDSLVDSDQVTRSFLPQVRERATGSTRQLPPAVERQVDSAIEQQLPNIRPVVRERLRQNIANLTGAAGVEVPFPALVLAIRALVGETREEGDVTIVPLRTNSDRPTELAMRRRADRWQLVGVRDPSITAALAAEVPTSLPAFTPGGSAPGQNLAPRRP